jgi:predicted aspartyl protease
MPMRIFGPPVPVSNLCSGSRKGQSIYNWAVERLFAAWLLAASLTTAGHVRELIAKDQWQEALAQAHALAADDPGADSVTTLGEALYRAGKIDEAGDALAPVAAGDDAPARALTQLGLVRAAQGKEAEALALMERAVGKAPRDPWVVYNASGLTRTRARAVELLTTYLETGTADDADRLEAARGTIRLDNALGERKVWVPVSAPDRLEIPLKPLAGTGGGFFIEATIGYRKKIRLLLDTGSTGLFVVERAVKKGGLSPLSEETVFAGGGAGRTASSRGVLPKITFGGLEFADALITTTKDEFDPQGRIHGVLGLNVFSGYRVTLDLRRGKLILGPAGNDAAGVPYWDVSGQMLVRASAAPDRSGLFLFDTGAVRSMIAKSLAETLPDAQLETSASVKTYGGNVAGALSVRGVRLRFCDVSGDGGTLYTADLTQRSRLGGVEVSGFLGMDLLDGMSIVVDTRAHRVAVAAAAEPR